MKKFFAILLASIMVMSLVACGGTKTKYNATSMSFYGYEMSWEEVGGGECYMELSTDGSFTFVFDGETSSGTYTQNGENISYIVNGNETSGTLSGTKLTFDYTEEDSDLGEMTVTFIFEKA